MKIRWTLGKKFSLVVGIAMLFTLIMGAPVAYLQYEIFRLGIFTHLSPKLVAILQTYFPLLINLLIFVIAITFALKKFVLKPILQIKEEMERMVVDGEKIDLTKRITLKSNDETKLLVDYINQFVNEVSMLIEVTKPLMSNVLTSAEKLSLSASETGKSAIQVATSISEISDGTAQQAVQIARVNQEILETKASVEQGLHQSTATVSLAQQSTKAAQLGNDAITKAITHLDSVSESVRGATQSILHLNERSKEIESIITTITGIAEQTNLLALNAAIEAARAGEEGKGFSVVASEVRKLAEQSNHSAVRIKSLIEEIQSETKLTVQLMENNLKLVEEQGNLIQDGGGSLLVIVKNVEETEIAVKEVEQSLHVMRNSSTKVLEAVTEISTIIEETASMSEDVSAVAQEQSATVIEISQSTENLTKMSKNLESQVERFIV